MQTSRLSSKRRAMLETYWTEHINLDDPLLKMRTKAWERFEAIGLPRKKQEQFQYLRKELQFPPLAQKDVALQTRRKGLVFVDGFYQEELSEIPSPFVCLSIEKAMKTYGLFLQNRIAKLCEHESDPFAALNGAFQGRGAFLYIPPNTSLDLSLSEIYSQGAFSSPRLHIFVGRGSTLNIEARSEGGAGFSNGFLDFVVDRDAKLHLTDETHGDFSSIRAQLKKGAEAKCVLLGSQVRTSIKMQLVEEEARMELYGLAHLEKTEESHIHALIEHIAPNCFSRQHFKSVLEDSSRFSFEGKIYVHPEAQKTQSYQLNNNLILSDEASANAKPNLEIFADDVKASHGATVGKLDEEELFYLRSRGLDLALARKWLIQGFCQEILDHARRIPNF